REGRQRLLLVLIHHEPAARSEAEDRDLQAPLAESAGRGLSGGGPGTPLGGDGGAQGRRFPEETPRHFHEYTPWPLPHSLAPPILPDRIGRFETEESRGIPLQLAPPSTKVRQRGAGRARESRRHEVFDGNPERSSRLGNDRPGGPLDRHHGWRLVAAGTVPG